MPLDGTGIWNNNFVVSKKEMIAKINSDDFGNMISLNNSLADPSRLYSFEDGVGIVGFIPSITEPFCQYCDRVRITTEGKLYTCLFDKSNYDLRELLEGGQSNKDIANSIKIAMHKKPEGIVKIIRLHSIKTTINNMYTIGG
jgi:cyclic pyranopterin phosphate synthase